MRIALLLGDFAKASNTAANLGTFANQIGALLVKQICELIVDVGPGDSAYFAGRLLSTLEVETRCAVAALGSAIDN